MQLKQYSTVLLYAVCSPLFIQCFTRTVLHFVWHRVQIWLFSFIPVDTACVDAPINLSISTSANPLPEDRLRYWNGYMLVYETMDEKMVTPKTPKTARLGITSRSFRASTSRCVIAGL